MVTRVQAADLRQAARKTQALRADGAEDIYLDIEVVIDTDPVAAFRSLDQSPESPGVLRYVGTPRGLAGLIADVQRLGIAEGVVLLTPDKGRVTDMMLAELAPGLPLTRTAA